MISKHISDREGVYSTTATRKGLANKPDQFQLANMKLLAEKVFEPLREWVGGPIRINRFFRCKALNKAITLTGLGSVDKTFGLFFGVFKGYIICVCFFSLLNWFYPHQKWPIETEDTYSFQIIYKGSEFLIEDFQKSKDYYEETEDKIEKI